MLTDEHIFRVIEMLVAGSATAIGAIAAYELRKLDRTLEKIWEHMNNLSSRVSTIEGREQAMIGRVSSLESGRDDRRRW